MTQAKKKSNVKWIITIISFVMSLIMFGAFIVGIFTTPAPTTDTLGTLDYAIGAIDDSGKLIESYKSIYSKEMHSTSGLDIDINEDNSFVTYALVFYDEDMRFLSISEELAEDYEASSLPEGAKYFRVVITPNQVDDADVIVSAFNIGKYANQLTVTFKI